jgi:hypothetical protein
VRALRFSHDNDLLRSLQRSEHIRQRSLNAADQNAAGGIPEPHPNNGRTAALERAQHDEIGIFGDQYSAGIGRLVPDAAIWCREQIEIGHVLRFMTKFDGSTRKPGRQLRIDDEAHV